MTQKAQDQFRKPLDVSDETARVILYQHILRDLSFPGMNHRFEEVADAHSATFEWMFKSDTSGRNLLESPSSELFMKWLSSGGGIFHVSGKLGSGKSTLMKFLYENSRTKEELEKWAGMSEAIRFRSSSIIPVTNSPHESPYSLTDTVL